MILEITKKPRMYSVSFCEILAFGFARKTATLMGFVACYGGGGKWLYGNLVCLRFWRIVVAVKLPVKNLKFFEVWWPKNYRL